MPLEYVRLDDPRLAWYRDLPRAKLTRRSGRFIAEGEKLVERLLASRFGVESLLVERRQAQCYAQLAGADVPVYVVERPELERIVGFRFHRGVLACGLRGPNVTLQETLGTYHAEPRGESPSPRAAAAPRAGAARGACSEREPGPLLLTVCIGVCDPENLGGIIRSSMGLGADAVLLGGGCADPFSRRVQRVSMGAVYQLPLREMEDVERELRELAARDVTLLASVLDDAAPPLTHAPRPPRLALLLGSEGHGLEPRYVRHCHERVTIPMHHGTDSLNVASAAAILLYHFATQRPRPKPFTIGWRSSSND